MGRGMGRGMGMVTQYLLAAVQSQCKMGRGSGYQNLHLKQQPVTINDAYTYSMCMGQSD